MTQTLQRRPAARVRHRWLAALLPLAFMLGILAVYGIRYTTNDDATLANIAAGAYGPDRVHLIYVNILFGWLLRPLYALAGGVNWYVLVQLGLVWLCAAALLDLAVQRLGWLQAVLLFGAVAVPFGLYYVYRFQYVKVSGLCVAAGLVLIACTLGQPRSRTTALGVGLALAGSLLRFDMFCAVGGLSAAVLLGRFFALDKAGKRRAVGTMLVLFALVFGCKGADLLAYRLDDGWNAYRQYNAARTAFSDYKTQRLPEENVLAAYGVSDNDYAVLLRWDYYDGEVFPAGRVQQLADAVPGKPLPQAAQDTAKTLADLLHGQDYRRPLALVLLAGLVLLRLGLRSLPFWGTAALLAAEVFYLTWQDRLPHYVEIPLLLAAVLLLLTAFGQGERRVESPRAAVAVCAAALAVLGLLSAPTYREWVAGSRAYREWAAAEQSYFDAMTADKENLYLLSTESINVAAGLDVWHPRGEGYFTNILAYGGWLSQAPHRQAVLQAYGLAQPLTGAVDKPNVYLSYHGIETAARYAAEHLGVPVQAVADGPNAFAPYRLVTAPPNAE